MVTALTGKTLHLRPEARGSDATTGAAKASRKPRCIRA